MRPKQSEPQFSRARIKILNSGLASLQSGTQFPIERISILSHFGLDYIIHTTCLLHYLKSETPFAKHFLPPQIRPQATYLPLPTARPILFTESEQASRPLLLPTIMAEPSSESKKQHPQHTKLRRLPKSTHRTFLLSFLFSFPRNILIPYPQPTA